MQSVDATDQFGETLVEAVNRGQNWRCRLRGLEWRAGLLAALQMFGQVRSDNTLNPTLSGLQTSSAPGPPAVLATATTNVGDLWTRYAKPLVLTAILGNPPTTPQALTATNAGLAPGQTSEFLMTSRVRELPLELCFVPYAAVIGSVTFNIPFSTI